MITARGPLPDTAKQDVKRWRPRFPREWLDEVELDGRFTRQGKAQPPKMRRRWSLILVGAVLAALGVPVLIDEQGPSLPGTVPHTRWIEGVIEDIGPGQEGALTVTVAGVGGKSATAVLNFASTSVYQDGHARHIGHLRPGQHVQMTQVQDQARMIEIMRQPPAGGLFEFR